MIPLIPFPGSAGAHVTKILIRFIALLFCYVVISDEGLKTGLKTIF